MKFTVLGAVVVISNVPAVRVNVPAIPNAEPVPNCKDVPFRVTLNRFAVPDNVEVPVNETVPTVAVREPLTERLDVIEKLVEAVMLPVTFKAFRIMVPLPLLLIILEEPLIVIVPPVAENVPVPLAEKFPVSVNELVVLIDPVRLKLWNEIPLPLIVFDAPLIVTVPPEEWVNVPAPLVVKPPPTVRFVVPAAVTPEPVIVRLLKLVVPVPLTVEFVLLIVTVLVLPVNVPLFVQLPATVCENEPPSKVVEVPMETLPLTVILFPAVKKTDVPAPSVLVRLPAMVITLEGIVLVAAPLLLLIVRFPYNSSDTV